MTHQPGVYVPLRALFLVKYCRETKSVCVIICVHITGKFDS